MQGREQTNVELLLSDPEIVKWLELDEQKDKDAKLGTRPSPRTRSSLTSLRDTGAR